MRGVTTIGVLAAVAFAGCGGASTSTETMAPAPAAADEFRAQLDGLCAEGQQRLVDSVGFTLPVTNDQQLVMMDGLAETQEEMTPEYEALTPPADLAEGFDNYLALREKRLAAAAKSAESGQESPDVGVLGEQMREQAEDLDLMDCAGQIDPGDEKIVGQIVVEDLKSPDPDSCADLYTRRYLNRFFPSEDPEEACRRELVDLEPPQSVVVDSITGQGPVATVSVTIDKGPEKPATAMISLLKADDGEWRVHDEAFYEKDE